MLRFFQNHLSGGATVLPFVVRFSTVCISLLGIALGFFGEDVVSFVRQISYVLSEIFSISPKYASPAAVILAILTAISSVFALASTSSILRNAVSSDYTSSVSKDLKDNQELKTNVELSDLKVEADLRARLEHLSKKIEGFNRPIDAAHLINSVGYKNITSEIEKTALEAIGKKSFIDRLESIFENQLLALSEGARFARANGASNRLYGVFIGILTVIALGVLLIFSQPSGEVNKDIFIFLSRTSLTILCAALTLFFLQQSRLSYAEAKFFQNERTTISSIHGSILTAIYTENDSLLIVAVTRLAGTERNGSNVSSSASAEAALIGALSPEMRGLLDSLSSASDPSTPLNAAAKDTPTVPPSDI